MSRVPDLSFDEMSVEQRRMYDEIKGPRGIVAGPFALWMRLPEVADAANRFGNALRLHGTLDRRLFELMVLVIARYWNAQYEWYAHETAAIAAGLGREIVEALRSGREPAFTAEDERIVYALVTELHATRDVSAATFARAVATFGTPTVIEAISVVGFYTTAAIMIKAFDAPVPGDARPLPDLAPADRRV